MPHPSSNCVFVRSKGTQDLPDRRRLEGACWKFHEAVISGLGFALILCLGNVALTAVCSEWARFVKLTSMLKRIGASGELEPLKLRVA